MAERVTAKRITAQQDNIECEHDRSNADAEVLCTGRIGEPHRFPRVVRKNENEEQRKVQEIAMNVLHDERKGIFAQVSFPRLADGAGGWIRPEPFVISTTVVVTGEPKTGWRP